MPLKHHTETAFLVILGIAIAVSGIYVGLLPELPHGLVYWAIGFVVSLAYPFIFRRTFRINRADYEFRLLHLFPAGMFALWMLMHLSAPYLKIMEILRLGFFYLWSMPVVALGLFFITVFASHVIRRRGQRIWAMILIGAIYAAFAFSAESLNINPELARAFFPYEDGRNPLNIVDVANITKKRIGYVVERQKRLFRNDPTLAGDIVAWLDGSSSSSTRSFPVTSSSSTVRSSLPTVSVVTVRPPVTPSSSSSSIAPTITKPRQLTQSGPEGFVVLGITLLALYAGTLHNRSRNRG